MLSFGGNEYAKARNRLGLVQVEAEELSGVSRRVIQKIEAGGPSVSQQSRRRLAIARVECSIQVCCVNDISNIRTSCAISAAPAFVDSLTALGY